MSAKVMDSESFLELLTRVVTGLNISLLDEKTRNELEQQSLKYFKESIQGYILDKYGKKYAIQIKIAQNDDSIFDKFPDLEDKLDEAWNAFFKQYI
jgi:hypothetical protein